MDVWAPVLDMSRRLACEWNEYISARALVEAEREGEAEGKIPAYEEALAFVPPWVALTKADEGLVEVWKRFAV